MGAALPVVATAVAGIPEILDHHATGWLVPPADSAALTAALVDVFADRARSAAIGTAARASVLPRFGVDGYVNSIVTLYDRLLAERPSAISSFGRTVSSH